MPRQLVMQHELEEQWELLSMEGHRQQEPPLPIALRQELEKSEELP